MNQEKNVVKSLRKKLVVIAIGGIILSSLSGCKDKEPVKDIDITQETTQETTQEPTQEPTEQPTEEPNQEPTEDIQEIEQEIDPNSLSGKMEAIYEGKPEEFPMLMGTELNEENMQWFLGTTELEFVEGYASEAMISSIAHSIVLVRFDSEAAATSAVDVLKTTVDPRKWICVGVEEDQVVIEAKGDLVVVILDPMSAELFHENFLNLE